MLLKLDKTVVLVAATKLLQQIESGSVTFWSVKDQYQYESKLNKWVDIYSNEKSKFIQSVLLDEDDYEMIESFLEDV